LPQCLHLPEAARLAQSVTSPTAILVKMHSFAPATPTDPLPGHRLKLENIRRAAGLISIPFS
jgi:hypothetical protein